MHSPLGPSSADRWLNCPGSVALTKDIPDPGSDYAAEGTVAHWLTEILRRDNQSPWQFIDKPIDGVLVTREMIDAVEVFCEYVDETPGDALIETRVSFDEWVPGGFGTLDDARLAPGKATITDFKYGKGVQVFAADNSQLKLYALGILAEWDWAYDFQTFILCVHQPRLDHIDTWSIARDELLAWAEKVVRPGAAATCSPEAPVRAGSWCQWCRIKTTCRVRAESVFRTVVGEFDSLDDAAAKAASPRALLTNDEVAVALTAIGNVKKWCAEVEGFAVAELSHGRPVGDWKLVEGRSTRKWGLSGDDLVKAWTAAGLSPEDLYETSLRTLPAAEKIAGKKHEIWKTDGLVNKPPGKPVLAPGSDPRPVLVVDPAAEFNVLGENDDG